MNKLTEQSDADQSSEGGMFYPTGYIVTAHETHDAAMAAAQSLQQAGFASQDVTVVSAAEMLEQAGRNLEHPGLLAALGGSSASRQQQYDLAEKGNSFLLIKAVQDAQEDEVVRVLADTSVRYATKYRTLIIENLMPKIPSLVAEPSPTPPR